MEFLTKSELMSFWQCPKKFWLEKHKPEAADNEPDEQMIANGEAVGEAARGLFPGGVKVDTLDLEQALATTLKLLPQGTTLFEPAFEHGGVRVRVDILQGDTLTEVKSGTSAKDHYFTDAAIQAWTTSNSGHRLSKVQLALLNPGFVYQGDGYEGLLNFNDATASIQDSYQHIPSLVENARLVRAGTEPPLILTGPQCNSPIACPFQGYCSAGRPEYPVESLPRSAKIVDVCRQNGIAAIADIPENWLTSEIHQRVRRTIITGQPEIDAELLSLIRTLAYPRYYLDFEAIAFAVPIWIGTSPHQHLPFQWSCHIETAPGMMEHAEFLDISGQPPMRSFAESLIQTLGKTGPIIVYSPYEKQILGNLCKIYPDLQPQLSAVINRLVDLLPHMRKHFYHPQQHGSWSIKALLPVVAPDLNYKMLENVHNGTEAQAAFMKSSNPLTDPATKQKLEQDMRAYCKLDTLAMVQLVKYLE
jgi:hypothetical protein